ncbi:MAG TPA: ABC transporter permease [Longimicrobiales bacterium]|nr:ABC transporter permease [Longimicrobiales bacterium]
MGVWRRITLGLRALLHREDAERDLVDEVRHYMEEAEAELMAGGATREEARRAVRLRHGDALAAREDVRSHGWEHWVDTLVCDLRLSVRNLRRSPGFTTVVVLTLGLGVGAATAIFSAVRPVLFEPLAYPHPKRILSVSLRSEDGSTIKSAFRTWVELSRRNRVFESLTVFKPWQPTLTGDAEPQRLEGQSVSAGYFDVLGVPPALGPGFDASADRPDGPSQVILGDALWRRRFGGDPAAVGRAIHLDGDSYTLVGVMPASFENVAAPQAQAWTLLRYDPSETGFDTREWGHHLDMMGRARAGVGPDEAREALDAIARQPVPDFPRPAWASLTRGFVVRPLRDATTADVRPVMLVFMGAVGLLLAVTCANLTLVLLARGGRRRGEFAMRAALGAGRGRLARYLLTESLVLAGLGGLLGVTLARAGLYALLALSPPSLPRLHAIDLDGAALAFALGATTLVGVVFGLAPGLHRSSGQPQAIREAGRGSGRKSRAARRTLVVTEVALAMVLLVGAGLILRSTQRLFSEPPGFDPSRLAVVQVFGTGLEPGDAVTHRFFDEALDAVRSVPGVVSATETSQLPLSGDRDVYGVTLVDGTPAEETDGPVFRYAVTPGYLETMGIRLLRGRTLTRDDVERSAPVAVISQGLARHLFQDRNPLGARIQAGPTRPDPFTIVGVVDDVKQASLDAEETEAVYVTSHQWHWADRVRWVVVRTGGDPAALVPSVQRAVWSVNADQPVVRTQSMETVVARSEARRRFVLVVMSAFALAALILAVIGLYGVVAGMVAERLPEIGVRAALGASYERIVAMVVRQGLTLTAAGLALGLLASLAASQVLATFLFQVSRADPLTYVGVVVVLAVGAVLACWVPAMRAARVDPVRTLKAE